MACWWPCCGQVEYFRTCGSDRAGSGIPVLTWIKFLFDGTPAGSGGVGDPNGGRTNDSIDIDPDENWYVGGSDDPDTGYVFKYDSGNSLVWQSDHVGVSAVGIQAVAVNDDGVVAFTTSRGDTGVYNSEGTLRWLDEFDGTNIGLGRVARDVQWLPSGNLGFVGQDTNIIYAEKDPSDGSIISTIATSSTLNNAHAISVDNSGNLHLFGSGSSGRRLEKYNSSLSQQWSVTANVLVPDGRPPVIGLAPDGSVYVPGARANDSSIVLQKFNSSGTSQWTVASNAFSTKLGLNGCACYPDSNDVFVSGRTEVLGSSDTDLQGAVSRIADDGSLVWGSGPLSGNQRFIGIVTQYRRPQWWA